MESNNDKPSPLNPTAMTIADAARLLAAAGTEPISESTILADVGAGAPTNADGTLNLVHYAAWLVREMRRAD